MKRKSLPLGVDDFKKIIQKNLYYVDKTLLIKELLDNFSEATLFTRPRRFGKTLNQSMIRYFFEDTGDEALNAENRALFDGLKIMEAGEEYTCHMQQYPVIFLSLKDISLNSFEMTFSAAREFISGEFQRHKEAVLPVLSGNKLKRYQDISENRAEDREYYSSLLFLSECLETAYKKKCIILIDEYDVPLENSYYSKFYQEMIDFIRQFLSTALKTNASLEFAVLTGCLRISRESIFTGLNNLRIASVLNRGYGEYFGFTPSEVREMTGYYGHMDRMDDIQSWYDGYIFGKAEVYNPWSVINFMADLNADENQFPIPYWSNTSSNSIVHDLIKHADGQAREDLEALMAGKYIEKPVHEDITYQDIHESDDNLWNFLFFTGYLKKTGERYEDRTVYLKMEVPNDEIMSIYYSGISRCFREKVQLKDLSRMYGALLDGDAEVLQQEICTMLMETISYMDSKEAFYHGFLAGILANIGGGYVVRSNREAGSGRFDLCVYSQSRLQPAYVLEFKIADGFSGIDEAAAQALAQIYEKKYDEPFRQEGYPGCYNTGIGFFGKNCAVRIEKEKFR